MMHRRTLLSIAAIALLMRRDDPVIPVTVEDDKTLVLDAWTVIMTRCERLRDIIKASYLHRDQDRELMKRVRTHLAEIESYLDRIDSRIEW